MKQLPATMHAMVLESPGSPLVYKTLPLPSYTAEQVLVKVVACGVCRTDLHIADAELPHPKLPLIPGHEIIGTVVDKGTEVILLKEGDLVGILWLGYTCGKCKYCLNNKENLCDNALFTGYTIDGGYAEYTVANQQYCFPLSSNYYEPSKTPLLCAGLIGYRSYTMLGENIKNIGLYGFGAAAHILIQIAIKQGKNIYAFTRDGDIETQQFAMKMGAIWAGDSSAKPLQKLDAAIIFAPVGNLVPKALSDMDKGGIVVCGGIHMSDIPSFSYDLLWEERAVRSVANLTRQDAHDFFELIADLDILTETQLFPLQEANKALEFLRNGKIRGAAVLIMS